MEALNILRDPVSLEELTFKNNKLINQKNNKEYKNIRGIIRFIEDEEIHGDNKKYMELYDKIARFYNFSNRLYFLFKFGGERKYRNQFLSELEINEGDRVIEISVGTADNFRYLPKNVELFGLDISFKMLQQAKRHLKKWHLKAHLFQGTAEQLPFKNESFDVVFHVGGINYFTNRHKAINEMIRIAKRGTKIVIVDETEQLVKKTYRKNPITKKYFSDTSLMKNIPSIVKLIPQDMLEIEYKEICKGLMYCLSFRKP